MDEFPNLKEKGNSYFKAGEYQLALDCYTQALKSLTVESSEVSVNLKNRAACHLKLGNYDLAISDCSKALESSPNDPKALFRRCQAYEALGKIEDAFKDAATLLRVDPKNAAIQPILERLNPLVQEKAREQQSTDNKVTQMFKLAFDNSIENEERRKQAANNLIVLAREEAGADKIFRNGGVAHLIKMLEEEKDRELKLTSIRVLACLTKDNKTRCVAILKELNFKRISIYIGLDDSDISLSMVHLLKNMMLAITDLEKIKEDRDKYEKARKTDRTTNMRPWFHVYDRIAADEMEIMNDIMPQLISMINQAKVSACGRDGVIELLTKFVTRKDGVGWSKRFIEVGGLRRALDVASMVPEHKTLAITASTHMHISLLLQKVYEDLQSDQERDLFRQTTDDFFVDLFGDGLMESKLEAVLALAALLQGPFEVGNAILGRPGVMEMLVAMADSGDLIHTKYAVEALVYSASKKDRCSGIIKLATPVLKALYQSPDDAIRVRALVGLCKLGSVGGADASAKSFAEGSTQTLAKACRKFLCNPLKDVDLKKWAAEGLAFLSLDADVKDDLVHDSEALKALFDLAKVADVNALYPIGQVLVNCTNSYDKAVVEPEMLELAKFAKHHIPEEHEKDKESYVNERCKLLVKAGVVGALVALSKAESVNSREMLSRTFLAVCTAPEHRGLVVQQGGVKALISLALEGTELGCARAAHALARIAITMNPEIAFPGQRALEVIRPLLLLLHIDRAGLENFEGLMALTNLTSKDDSVRRRLISEKGVGMVEHWCYEEHEMIRRAAVECMCNLVMNDEVAAIFKGENDRVKLLMLYCLEEDESLIRAAMGALAILSHDTEICHKIITCTTQWCDILQGVSASHLPDIQHRGVYVLRNLMAADREIAQRLVESNVLEVLMAVSKLEEPGRQLAQECAKQALDSAVEWGLIERAH